MLIDYQGNPLTAEQINAAFAAGKARLVHARGLNRTVTSLALDGQDFDTRGQCYQMAEEAWTQVPETIQAAFSAAHAE